MTARREDEWQPHCAGLDDATAGVGLIPAFQPIVTLAEQETIGYEALARWPELPGCTPDAVFQHATAIGSLDALDELCVGAAIASALRSGLSSHALLCINAEPATAYRGRSANPLLDRGHRELTIMFEITERSVLAHPRSLVRKVTTLRRDGFAIALDDVGAQPDSLSLLDVICPDVIKLDLALVQAQPDRNQARTLDAVLAYQERSQATILAEGIESDEHLEQALAVGATLGQGYLFGRPGPLDHSHTAAWPTLTQRQFRANGARSPFDLVGGTAPVRTARKGTLLALSRHIESRAAHAVDPPMVFTALQLNEYFRGATRDRYRQLARSCPLVAVFGQDMPYDLGAGVRGVAIDPVDPLCAEWTVVVLGPHDAAALIARERDHGHGHDRARSDADRRFDYVITHDRSVVTAAARGLLDRMK